MTSLRFDEPGGRTLHICIVPDREPTLVEDGYVEEILPGAFRDQVEEARNRPLRIWLHREHRDEDNVVGHATSLHDLPGGLYGLFNVHAGNAGDQALAAIRAGELVGASLQAKSLRSRTVNGITQRQKVHLGGVALVPDSAYPAARVVGIRKARSGEQAGPASTDEAELWELERLDGQLRALARHHIDEAPRHYTRNPRYQAALRLLAEITADRAEIEQRLRPQPDPEAAEAEALRPKVLRRVLSGPIAIH
jgi:HK97 family phage prohead protease